MAASGGAEAAPALASMPPEILQRVLRAAGPRATSCAACACVRLRDAQRELAAASRGCFASALVRMVRRGRVAQLTACASTHRYLPPLTRRRAPPQPATGSPVALAAAAAAAATRQALDGLEAFSGDDSFVIVLCSPASGVPPRLSLAAAVEAALQRLPAGVCALGITGASVWGPEALAGGGCAARDMPRAVSVLLGRVPGCHVACSGGDYPDLRAGGAITAADSRLAAWLGAPADIEAEDAAPAQNAAAPELAFCAFFLAPQRRSLFLASPHVSRAWPAAALVGGIASARGGAGAVATGTRALGAPPVVRPARDAVAISVFARGGGGARPAPRSAADAARGLRPSGAVWAVSSLEPGFNFPPDERDEDPAARLPFLLSANARVAAGPESAAAAGPAAAAQAGSVWRDVFITTFEQQTAAFVRVWRAGATAAEEAAARAAARAVAAECQDHGAHGEPEVLLWAHPGVLNTPDVAAALAEGRLRCQVHCVDAVAAAEDAAAAAARLGAAVAAPGRATAVLAAACSARGRFLFPEEAEEARALAAAFPNAFAGLTVDGELGPPPEGGAAVLQSFTTTLAAMGA